MPDSQPTAPPPPRYFRIFDLPFEMGQKIFAEDLPNLEILLFVHEVRDASGNIITKRAARVKNKSELRSLTNVRLVSKGIDGLVKAGLAEGVRTGRLAVQFNILGHPRRGQVYSLRDEDMFHATKDQNLEDGFIEECKLASGQKFRRGVTHIPIGFVDITSHSKDIVGHLTGRDIIYNRLYTNHDPETLMMAEITIDQKRGLATWTVDVKWAEISSLFPAYEAQNQRRRKLSNGEIQEYDAAIVAFTDMVANMQSAVEDFIQKGVVTILPDGTDLSVEALCHIQQLVVSVGDAVAGTSTEWTTRYLNDALNFIHDQFLHENGFEEIVIQDLTFESRASPVEWENVEEEPVDGVPEDDIASGTSNGEEGIGDTLDGDALGEPPGGEMVIDTDNAAGR